MKLITAKDRPLNYTRITGREQAHYRRTLWGGFYGGSAGFASGLGAVALAQRRFPAFQALTLPLKAFLVTSATTFGAIISADRESRKFEKAQNEGAARVPDARATPRSTNDATPAANSYRDVASQEMEAARASADGLTRLKTWGRENRYGILAGSWATSMAVALGLVGRSPYLSRAQKLVQARVYAQALTVAVLCASAGLEIGDANRGEGRWETVRVVDPADPEHKRLLEKKVHRERYQGEDLWKDIVEQEERTLETRARIVHEQAERGRREHRQHPRGGTRREGHDEEEEEEDEKEEGKEEKEEHHDEPAKPAKPAEADHRPTKDRTAAARPKASKAP
ncbi:MAG: hypothetical protein M1826_002600 [Phylliscum demangeonii]|nr:MAG: hypothetical protein M1826_002600 [Phylliscum demangeonii]